MVSSDNINLFEFPVLKDFNYKFNLFPTVSLPLMDW